MLNCAASSAMISFASVSESLPAMKSRALNGDSSARSTENFRFHAQTSFEMCRYNRFENPLRTGRLTLAKSEV